MRAAAWPPVPPGDPNRQDAASPGVKLSDSSTGWHNGSGDERRACQAPHNERTLSVDADMTDAPPPTEEIWRAILLGTDRRYARTRAVLRRLPHAPRCKMCAAPFAGPMAPLMRITGRGPWSKNRTYCGNCFHVLERLHGGAEIECTLLFADVRGSTAMGERLRPSDFRALLDRFYDVAAEELVRTDAIIDKFVGDEVMAIFVPAIAGAGHAAKAIEAARRLLAVTGQADGEAAWLPLGAGVHTGIAFVGAVGDAPHTELTALGDTVNTAARLAAAAGAGEILVSEPTASAAGLATQSLERRSLDLKGKQLPTDVFVVRHG